MHCTMLFFVKIQCQCFLKFTSLDVRVTEQEGSARDLVNTKMKVVRVIRSTIEAIVSSNVRHVGDTMTQAIIFVGRCTRGRRTDSVLF